MKTSYYEQVRFLFQIAREATAETDILPFEDFFTKHPKQPEPYFLLGLIFFRLSDLGRSIQLFNEAHNLNPECVVYVDALACVETLTGRLSTGLYFAKLALTCHAHQHVPELHLDELSNYGQALLDVRPSPHYYNAFISFNKRDFVTCDQECDKHLSIHPKHIDSYILKIKSNLALGEFTAAVNTADIAIKIKNNHNCAELYLLKGQGLLRYGMIIDAVEQFDQAFIVPSSDHNIDMSHLAKAINCFKNTTSPYKPVREQLLNSYLKKLPNKENSRTKRQSQSNQKLHIAYFTDEAYTGPIGSLLQHLLYNHNKEHFHISVYQANINEDHVTQQLQNLADNWQRIHDLNPYVLDHIIENEKIDIAIDFIGLSENRPHVAFARHHAFIQLGWLNTPYIHESLNLDYYLCGPLDVKQDPDKNKQHEIIQLSGGVYTTSPSPFIAASEEASWMKKGSITFGLEISLDSLRKEDVAIWQELINQHPTANILLLPAAPLTKDLEARIKQLLAATGLQKQISLFDKGRSALALNQYLQSIDIFISIAAPSTHNLLLHCYEALIPVISYSPSSSIEDNVSAGINSAAQRPEWNVTSLTSFRECLYLLSNNFEALEKQRKQLNVIKQTSTLFNPKKYTKMIEATYQKIYARHSTK